MRAAVDAKAIGFDERDLALMDFFDIRREQRDAFSLQASQCLDDRICRREAFDARRGLDALADALGQLRREGRHGRAVKHDDVDLRIRQQLGRGFQPVQHVHQLRPGAAAEQKPRYQQGHFRRQHGAELRLGDGIA